MGYKKLALVIILALLSSLLVLSSYAATSWTGAGLSGKQVFGLASASSGVMYAATPDAIYKKTGGADWVALGNINAPVGTDFFAVAASADGATVYAAFWGWGDGALYRSTNGGSTWSKVASSGFQVLALAPDGTLYAAGPSSASDANDKIYILKGSSWSSANLGDADIYITSLAAVGSTVYAGTDSGVYKSTNSGAGWSRLSGSANLAGPLFVATATEGTVFAATEGAGIYQSTNGGSSWVRVEDGPNAVISSLAASAAYATDKTIFAGTDGAGVLSFKVGDSSGTTPGGGSGNTGGTGNAPGAGGTTSTTVLGARIFSDVPANAWYRSYVEDLFSRKVIHGYPNGEFRPQNSVSRAEFSKTLCLVRSWKLLSPAVPSFGDCPRDNWAYGFIETAKANRAINGYTDGDVRPGNNITRAEIAKMLARSLNLDVGETTLADIDRHWARDYIGACVRAGIAHGYTDGFYRPDNAVTRAEAAKMLHGALKK